MAAARKLYYTNVQEGFMVVLGSRFGRTVLGLSAFLTLVSPAAFAQQTDPATQAAPPSAPIDPYAPAPPPTTLPPTRVRIPAPQPAPPPPPPAVASASVAAPETPPAPTNSGTSTSGANSPITNNSNQNTVSPTITANPHNTNTSNPTNTNTANPVQTNTSTNTNDNRSNAAATATNNNTIYIYPPSMTPPAPPPIVAPPSILPPPLVPPPAMDGPYQPGYASPRVRLDCQRLCQRRQPQYQYPPYLAPMYQPTVRKPPEKFRVVTIGGHYTIMGMAHQPLAGWATLQGGGISLEFRSRGHFGFEMSQDFLKGSYGPSDAKFQRKSYPFEFTFKGYVARNSDRNHFNMYFGGGLGAMSSTVNVPFASDGAGSHQDFLEWMVHGDIGAELRIKFLTLGIDGRIDGLFRDRSYGAGAYYGNLRDAPVPASTWGAEGRAFMNFSF